MAHYFRNQDRFMAAGVQGMIHQNKRTYIVDWIVQIHNQFNLKCETLYLTLKIFDNHIVNSGAHPEFIYQLQQNDFLRLIASTCIFISSKYEEIYPPSIKDLLVMFNFNKMAILEYEGKVMNSIQFNLTMPSSYSFLECYFLNDETLDLNQKCLSNFLLHLSLHDSRHIIVQPSKISAASILVVKKLHDIQNDNVWTQQL